MRRIRDRAKTIQVHAQRGKYREAKRILRRKALKSKRARRSAMPRGPRSAGLRTIAAPEVLSIVHNRDEMLAFITALSVAHFKRKPVFVSLTRTTSIHHDGLLLLLSILVKFKDDKIFFNGNFPESRVARRTLLASSFLRRLYQDDYRPDDAVEVGLHTHANKDVDATRAAAVITQMTRKVFGRPRTCRGIYSMMIELMHNTNNHASLARKRQRHWWLSTSYDRRTRTAAFAFLDVGVGVFTSLRNKGPGDTFFQWLEQLPLYYTPEQQPNVLRRILDGEMHATATGKYYRGKGLPQLKEVLEKNGISKLIIMTNNVYADVGSNKFELLNTPMMGTFYYWELSRKNRSWEDV